MPEFDLDKESVFRAEGLAAGLMEALETVSQKGPEPELRRELFSEERYLKEANGVPIQDVLADVGQMAMSLPQRGDCLAKSRA
jgi:hypothetical protein